MRRPPSDRLSFQRRIRCIYYDVLLRNIFPRINLDVRAPVPRAVNKRRGITATRGT